VGAEEIYEEVNNDALWIISTATESRDALTNLGEFGLRHETREYTACTDLDILFRSRS